MSKLSTYLSLTLNAPESVTELLSEGDNLDSHLVAPGLLEFWEKFGFGSYDNGFFWTCRPSLMRMQTESWIAKLEIKLKEMLSIVGYTSSNILYALSKKNILYRIDLNWANIIIVSDLKSFPSDIQDMSSTDAFAAVALTSWRNEHQILHRSAARRIGKLDAGEIYGFLPALQIGGECCEENLRVFKAAEHWAMLSELLPFTFYSHN